MAIVVMIGTVALVAAFVPGGAAAMRSGAGMSGPPPSMRYYASNIALSLVAAMVGGWLTARIASHAIAGHLIALAAVVLVMGFVSAVSPGSSRQPMWYKLVIPLVGIAGVAVS